MLIPDNIQQFQSLGERFIYHQFKNDINSQGYYVLHSVFTNHHLTNVSGELDFLVLAPGLGFFAIEVKHGNIERKDGTWIILNSVGKPIHKTKSPFMQVEDTKHSIRNYILNNVSNKKKDRLKKILFATGVAFTSTTHSQMDIGPEGFEWQIFTKEDFSLPISKYIKRLSDGWHQRYSVNPWYEVNMSRPTLDDCEEVLKIIRGDFKINYSELNRISDNQKSIEEFTQEQFNVIDYTEFNERCLIEGQAGTGKTIIALELARRKIQQGKKVALFCFNQMLGDKLKKSIDSISDIKNHNSYSGTLHKYLAKHSVEVINKENEFEYFTEYLPLNFLIQSDYIREEKKYDYLIIDEAQDLLIDNYLEVFDLILKRGIKNGEWTMFGDFTNQAIYINNPEKSKNLLEKRSCFIKLPSLKINCRNTKKISLQNTLVTGIDKPTFSSYTLEGSSIDVYFPRVSKQLEILEREIQELIQVGVEPEMITILSPKSFESTYAAGSDVVNVLIKKGLQYSTIQAFKGLENVVIILYDFSEISSVESKRLLYIGISRATQVLKIILSKDIESAYQSLISSNINKL